MQYDEWIPALLCFLINKVENISEAEYIILLEKITIQNWVRRLGRAARLTIYYKLIRAILDGKTGDDLRQIFREEADNQEFSQLIKGEIYTKPFANAVLLRLEEGDKDDSVIKTYTGLVTIEHVLPQSRAEEYWQERFVEEEHQKLVHTLGNLTLLSGRKNYKAQNKPFPDKKKRYEEKHSKVSFDMTKFVCEQNDWTKDIIEQRQKDLVALAESIWHIN